MQIEKALIMITYKQTLRLNNLLTKTAMNAKISVFIICCWSEHVFVII